MPHKYVIKKVTEKTMFMMATEGHSLLIGFDFRRPSARRKVFHFECWELELAFLEELIDQLVAGHQALEAEIKKKGHH